MASASDVPYVGQLILEIQVDLGRASVAAEALAQTLDRPSREPKRGFRKVSAVVKDAEELGEHLNRAWQSFSTMCRAAEGVVGGAMPATMREEVGFSPSSGRLPAGSRTSGDWIAELRGKIHRCLNNTRELGDVLLQVIRGPVEAAARPQVELSVRTTRRRAGELRTGLKSALRTLHRLDERLLADAEIEEEPPHWEELMRQQEAAQHTSPKPDRASSRRRPLQVRSSAQRGLSDEFHAVDEAFSVLLDHLDHLGQHCDAAEIDSGELSLAVPAMLGQLREMVRREALKIGGHDDESQD